MRVVLGFDRIKGLDFFASAVEAVVELLGDPNSGVDPSKTGGNSGRDVPVLPKSEGVTGWVIAAPQKNMDAGCVVLLAGAGALPKIPGAGVLPKSELLPKSPGAGVLLKSDVVG